MKSISTYFRCLPVQHQETLPPMIDAAPTVAYAATKTVRCTVNLEYLTVNRGRSSLKVAIL